MNMSEIPAALRSRKSIIMAILFVPLMLLALPLAAAKGLDPDGLGWDQVRLGADYESVKEAFRKDGWSIFHNLGGPPGEIVEYSKRFQAKAPKRPSSIIEEVTVFGERWENRIYEISISLVGIDYAAIQADLVRFFGNPDQQDKANGVFKTPKVIILASFMNSRAHLQFYDRVVKERISLQYRIDNGEEAGILSGWGPLRKPASAETAWIMNFMNTAIQSLPPVPNGFEIADQTDVVEPALIGNEEGKRPVSKEYLLVLVNRQNQETQMQSARAKIEATQSSQQPKMDEFQAKIKPKLDALQKQMAQSAEKQDFTAVERLQLEVARILEQGDALLKDAEEASSANGLGEKLKDVRLSVRVAINQDEALGRGEESARNIAGHSTYFRLITKEDSAEEESETTVLLGSWQTDASIPQLRMKALWNPALSGWAGQNLVVEVRGDPARSREYLDSIQWKKLAALLMAASK